ncbi:MAG: hypothetical protein PWQ37_2085 [Candidatus Petromonas sp.]|jgi:transcriptional regulator with PAS, ATPase and Fis domain|nr:hypothetical protein [Candidatus Petromonas sp.]
MSKEKCFIEISSVLKTEIESMAKKAGLSIDAFLNKLIKRHNINQAKVKEPSIWHHQTKLETVLNENKNYSKKTLTLDAISNSLYDGLYIADGNGYTIDVNKAFTRITDIRREEVVGMHLKTLVEKNFFDKSVALMVLEQKNK